MRRPNARWQSGRRSGRAKSEGHLITLPGSAGAHAGAEISSLAAGTVVGADSIENLDVLRHGGVAAPVPAGALRTRKVPEGLDLGHARQLDVLARPVRDPVG